MDRLKATLEVLNDLVEVNGQRIWSYEAALEGTGNNNAEGKIHEVFEQIVAQGQQLQEELELQFVELANDLPTRGNPKGTVLQTWDIVKSIFARKDSMPISEFFDVGERALLSAYRYAEKRRGLVPSCKKLIARQKAELLAFYRRHKQLYRNHQLASTKVSPTLF